MRPCIKCGSTERYKSGDCIPCSRIRCNKYRADHPEKCREICAKRRETHREEAKERAAKYRAENPDKVKIAMKTWHDNNKEYHNLYKAKWQKENPEKCTASSNKRRANKLNAIPKWFGELDELIILEATHLRKLREKMTGFKWHVDHIVPLQSKKVCGLHIGCNIQVIPALANQSKSNRHWPNMPE